MPLSQIGLGRKLTSRLLCERYNVVPRTIDRWVMTGVLPQPMRINTVRYWDEVEVETAERARMANRKFPPTADSNPAMPHKQNAAPARCGVSNSSSEQNRD